jgi:hypothetical protein
MKKLIAVVFAAASCSFGLFSNRLTDAAKADGAETQSFTPYYYRFDISNKTSISLSYKWNEKNYRIEPGQVNHHEVYATIGTDSSATIAKKPVLRFDGSFEKGFQSREYTPGELFTSKSGSSPVYYFSINSNSIGSISPLR